MFACLLFFLNIFAVLVVRDNHVVLKQIFKLVSFFTLYNIIERLFGASVLQCGTGVYT